MTDIDPNIRLYVADKSREERNVSDGRYAPYITWTIVLGILGLFGVAIVMRLISLLGL